MEVRFHRRFSKAIHKQPKKVQQAFKKRLRLYVSDPYSPILQDHALTGKLTGTRSFSVTGDVRVHYENISNGIVILDIGTHAQLYG